MRLAFSIYVLFLLSLSSYANNVYEDIMSDPNKGGGVYYAYPIESRNDTPAPKGYSPFYISHIGRHGSRYLQKESDYTNPLKTLKLAHERGVLTSFGENLYQKVESLYSFAKDRAGDLTEKGVQQHKQIAKRMIDACPEVFADSNIVVAHSTMVMRCAMSMSAFTEALKEVNPQLKITREPSEKHVKYLSYQSPEMKSYNDINGPWQKEYQQYRNSHTPYETFMPKIFKDTSYINGNINPVNFTCQIYNIVAGAQNLSVKFNFEDVFSLEELFELWKIYNFRMYAHYSNYHISDGVVLRSSIPLLKDIVERANTAILCNRCGADLRFGHDINIIPLTGLIGFEGCDIVVDNPEDANVVFQDYNISPMASNIQIIFYKNKLNNIIVKFLLNEQEIKIPLATNKYPYYDWENVKKYLESKYNQ